MGVKTVHTVAEARSALAGGTAPVVLIPVYNAWSDVVRCYEAVFRHTPFGAASFLVLDDRGADRRVATTLQDLQAGGVVPHDVVVLEQSVNKGFVGSVNDGFSAAGRRDVVVLNSDVVVGPGWLEGLQQAAYADSTTATASTLTNHGSVLSVPHRNRPVNRLPDGVTVDQAAQAVMAGSARLRPRLPTAIGHCTYIKRMALDVLGGFDQIFAPGYGEEVDLSQRAVAHGLRHVAADDVFVFHRGGSSFNANPRAQALRDGHEEIIRTRYPAYHPLVARTMSDQSSTLATAILLARTSLLGLRVAVDARCLGPHQMGTQRVVVETVKALAVHPSVRRVDVVVPASLPPYAQEAFAGLDRVAVLQEADAHDHAEDIDVAYRPYQVNQLAELEWLRRLGARTVISQLDLIAYHNPAYAPSPSAWTAYRDLTHLANAVADGVTFISRHAADDARAEGLADAGQVTSVVYCGTDHYDPAQLTPRCPGDPEQFGEQFLLVLGVSYKHKNRPFALAVLEALHSRGWRGKLVLAGPHPPDGSSTDLEAEHLLRRPELREHVVELSGVDEDEKAWLYQHAGVVLYPTLVEGFGLVPFEAARVGTPCLASRQGSLDEVLPKDVPTIDDWDPQVVADQVQALLVDPERRQALCRQLEDRGADFTWSAVADRLLRLFDDVCRQPRRRTHGLIAEDGGIAAMTGLSTTPAHLGQIGGAPLPDEVLQLVRAVNQRPALRRAVFGSAAAAYRAISRGRSAARTP